jgi:MarR family transcriptional regulator for hemolysin
MGLDDRLGRKLALTGKYLRERFEERLAEHGASMPTWILLSALSEGDGISQRELAARMHIEGPTLVRHLDRLEDEGLLRRRRSEEDRRTVKVQLTAAGRRRHVQLLELVDGLEHDLRGIMSEREQAILARLLDRIYEHAVSHRHHGQGHGAIRREIHAHAGRQHRASADRRR